jgi:hypothetical protein
MGSMSNKLFHAVIYFSFFGISAELSRKITQVIAFQLGRKQIVAVLSTVSLFGMDSD